MHISRGLVSAFLALLLVSGCVSREQRARSRLKEGRFSFRLPDLEGNIVSGTDPKFKDKVVLVDIWGTWCPPCREMTPFLKKLHADLASEGLVVVGIAFEILQAGGADPKDLVTRYVTHQKIEFSMLYGGAAEHPSGFVFEKLPFLEFDGFPTTIVLDRDGSVKWNEVGFDAGIASRLESLVRNLLEKN